MFTAAAFSQSHVLSPTFQINERVKSLWAAGQSVYHFGFGESRFPVHPKLQKSLQENAHRKGYLPVQGLAALRDAIAGYDGRLLEMAIAPQQVFVGPGSKALIYALQMALEGDLLLPVPSWVSYAPQARMLGKPVRPVWTPAAANYALTFNALETAVREATSETKILLLNSPNNPTGQMLDPDFLPALAAYCRERRIIVISDEIYSQIGHGPRPHVSLARYYPEGTIVVGGLSKHLSLGGWRIGKAIIPRDQPQIGDALRAIASEIWSTPTGPLQYTAVAAYSRDPEIESYIAECSAIHAMRSQYLWSMLTEMGINCAQPQGGFYIMPNFDRWREPLARRGVRTATDLAHYLLEDYHIATLPGEVFGLPEQDLSLRLATSYVDMEDDDAAYNILAAWRRDPEEAVFIGEHHPQMNQALDRFQQFIGDLYSG